MKDGNKDGKWNTQSFLLDYYKQWLSLQENHKNRNFIQITGNTDGLMNRIFRVKSDKTFFNIKQHQVAGMVPLVKLYKVVYPHRSITLHKPRYGEKYEVHMPFDTHTDIDDITKSRMGRGADVGLKSITWSDLGTTPADSGFSFKLTMVMYFQSFDALFKKTTRVARNAKKSMPVPVSWADLVVPPAGKKNQIPRMNANFQSAYRDQDFQMKVVVGWAKPSDPNESVYDKGMLHAINNQKVSFMLTLSDHNININQDGSLELEINYFAAIEGRMLNTANADLLYVEEGQKPFGDSEIIKTSAANIAEQKTQRAQTKTKLKEHQKKKKNLLHQNQAAFDKEASQRTQASIGMLDIAGHAPLAGLKTPDQRTAEQLEEQGETGLEDELSETLQNIDNAIAFAESEIANATYVQRAHSYARLIEKIQNCRRIYQVAITHKIVETWVASISRFEDITESSLRNEVATKNRRELKNKVLTMFKSGQGSIENNAPMSKELASLNSSLMAQVGAESVEQRAEIIKNFLDSKGYDTEPGVGEQFVKFFFFGDLVDAALELVFRPDPVQAEKGSFKRKGYTKESFWGGKELRPTKQDFKFLLGPIEMVSIDEAGDVQKEKVPLSHIPISLDLFDAWFVKNVIKPMRTTLTLKEFLRMVASELIAGGLSPMTYGPVGQHQRTRTTFSTFSLPLKRLNQDPFQKGQEGKIEVGDINTNVSAGAYHRSADKVRSYFLMQIPGMPSTKRKGDADKDWEQGIFHFKFGQDRGITKTINFQKTDIPGYREARLPKALKAAQQNLLFSNKYKATIETIGVVRFKPGQLVYIDPISFGLGKNSVARNLGIGGYYRVIKVDCVIEDGAYNTTLNLEFECPAKAGFAWRQTSARTSYPRGGIPIRAKKFKERQKDGRYSDESENENPIEDDDAWIYDPNWQPPPSNPNVSVVEVAGKAEVGGASPADIKKFVIDRRHQNIPGTGLTDVHGNPVSTDAAMLGRVQSHNAEGDKE